MEPHKLASALDGLTNSEHKCLSFYMRALFWPSTGNHVTYCTPSWPRLSRSTRTPSFIPSLGRCQVKFSGSTVCALTSVPRRLLWPLHFHHAPIPWFCCCRLRILPLPTPYCPYSRFWLMPTFSLSLVHGRSLLVGLFKPWRMFHASSRFPARHLSIGCQIL